MRFFYLLLLYVFCVCFEADHGVVAEGGIVKQYLEDGNTPVNTTPLKTMSPHSHTQYLECFYEHKFESIAGTTDEKGNKIEHKSQHRHAFFLQCVQLNPSQDAYLFVFFNRLPIERLTVTSCNKDDVQQSIFPPRPDYVMGHRYGEVYEDKNDRYVLSIYLVYKDVSGEYYQRLYSVDDTKPGGFELMDRKEKASFGGAECCHNKFSCQAPSKEFKSTGSLAIPRHSTTFFENQTLYSGIKLYNSLPSDLMAITDVRTFRRKLRSGNVQEKTEILFVIGVANPDRTAPLSFALINEPGTTKQLVCTTPLAGPKSSDFSYELICVKTRKNPEGIEDEESSGDKFLAFVIYGSSNAFPVERFIVTSCTEDDIVNSIFPGRLIKPEYMAPRLGFKHADGKGYEHYYNEEGSKYTVKWNIEKRCLSGVLGWVHPSIRAGSVMWLSCKGPTSASGEPKTLP